MNEKNNLTQGSVGRRLVSFAMPYLLAAFLQTFYGITDLYVVGRFDSSATVTAVSIGSQVMHMVTVIILGLAMGAAVQIGRKAGAGAKKGGCDRNQPSFLFICCTCAYRTAVFSGGKYYLSYADAGRSGF